MMHCRTYLRWGQVYILSSRLVDLVGRYPPIMVLPLLKYFFFFLHFAVGFAASTSPSLEPHVKQTFVKQNLSVHRMQPPRHH